MSFTYAELKTAIQDFTDNTETSFVNNLPVFIRTAEERIFKLVDLENFRINQSASMSTGNRFFGAPSNFLASFSLSISVNGSKQFLLQKDVNFLQEYWPDSSEQSVPAFYALFDDSNFIIAPTPDADYAAELHYYYRPTSLTAGAAGGTTWLSVNAPNALLYASLTEAYIYMKGEQDVLALYEQRFQESLMRLKNLAEGRENNDAYRKGLPTQERT
jgi:hypothetical protein